DDLVHRFRQALLVVAVPFFAREAVLYCLHHCAVSWKRALTEMLRRIPQPRPDQGSWALRINALNGDDDHAAWDLPFHPERFAKLGVDSYRRSSIDPESSANPRDQESKEILGSRTRFRSVSMRLFPRRSGSMTVCLSTTRT